MKGPKYQGASGDKKVLESPREEWKPSANTSEGFQKGQRLCRTARDCQGSVD